ncbi:MAG: hypothetical protein KAS93_06625 [Gammaproteobacteria bacterium]|nr:hypothetical protein [Gammaproteobacteria bacterium]
MTDNSPKENQKHTPETIMKKLEKCETEVGMQMEALRNELNEHQDIVTKMHDDWEQFLADFKEMLTIFRSAKGFFTVLGWIGTAVKWIAIAGIAIGTIIAGIKSGTWK